MANGGMHKMPDGQMMKDSDMKKMAYGGTTKKMAKGGGIREGKARFGDDVRERARKAIAEQMSKAENKSKFGGKEPPSKPKPKPVAKKPAPAAKPKPNPLRETASEAARRAPRPNSLRETASEAARRAPRPSAPPSRPKLKPQPGGVGILGMFGVEDPQSGTINEDKRDKPTMSKGGSVAKRADGVVKRGKTKGRMI